MRRWIAVAGLFAVLACASSSKQEWRRADGSENFDPEQLNQDRAECLSTIGFSNPNDPYAMRELRRRGGECMRQKGWARVSP